MQHLNIHPTATKRNIETQAAERSKALEIPISINLRKIGKRHHFEDPRLARPDDPSFGSTRPAAWDKDMSAPVAAVGPGGFVELSRR